MFHRMKGSRAPTRAPIGLLAVGLVFALGFAWLPLETSLSHFIYEDMFYYLKIAQNLVEGRGSSFDGSAPTNGYHPLWMVVCAALGLVFSGNLLVHAVLTVGALLHVVQAALLGQIVREHTRPSIALAVMAFHLFNWRALSINLCGLETPLAIVLVLLVVRRLLLRPADPTVGASLSLGLTLGIAIASRFDLLLLGAFAGLWVVLDRRYPSFPSVATRLETGALVTAGALIALTPWFIFSHRVSSTFLPNSRHAVAMRNPIDYDLANADGTWDTLVEQAQSLGAWAPDTANFFGVSPLVVPDGMLVSAMALAALAGFTFVGAHVTRRRRQTRLATALLIYACLHTGYYILFLRAELRYLMPAAIVGLLAIALIVDGVLRHKATRDGARLLWVLAALCFANAALAGVRAWSRGHGATRTHGYHALLLKMADWTRHETPPDTVLGAFNAGILGYFSDRTVVNLDGVVNDEALAAMRTRELAAYMDRRDVSIVVDVPRQLEEHLATWGGGATRMPRIVHRVEDEQGRQVVAGVWR